MFLAFDYGFSYLYCVKYVKIKEVLKAQGRTQTWLATQIGMSDNGLSNLVTGQTTPSLQRVFQIAEALDVPVCELLVNNKEA